MLEGPEDLGVPILELDEREEEALFEAADFHLPRAERPITGFLGKIDSLPDALMIDGKGFLYQAFEVHGAGVLHDVDRDHHVVVPLLPGRGDGGSFAVALTIALDPLFLIGRDDPRGIDRKSVV